MMKERKNINVSYPKKKPTVIDTRLILKDKKTINSKKHIIYLEFDYS